MSGWGGGKAGDGREGGGAVLVLERGGVLVLQLATSRPVSELSKLTWVGGEGGKDHPLLVVGSAQHLQKQAVNSCSPDD